MRPSKQEVLQFQEGKWKYASKYPPDLLVRQGKIEEFQFHEAVKCIRYRTAKINEVPVSEVTRMLLTSFQVHSLGLG